MEQVADDQLQCVPLHSRFLFPPRTVLPSLPFTHLSSCPQHGPLFLPPLRSILQTSQRTRLTSLSHPHPPFSPSHPFPPPSPPNRSLVQTPPRAPVLPRRGHHRNHAANTTFGWAEGRPSRWKMGEEGSKGGLGAFCSSFPLFGPTYLCTSKLVSNSSIFVSVSVGRDERTSSSSTQDRTTT